MASLVNAVSDPSQWSSSMFATFVVAAIGAYWLYSSIQSRKQRGMGLVQPDCAPLSMWQTIQQLSGPHVVKLFEDSARSVQSSIYRLNLPIPHVYVVGKASQQREILLDEATEKPIVFYQAFEILLGRPSTSSRTTSDPRWKELRKALAPAFSATEVSRMNAICQKYTLDWLDNVVEKELADHPTKTFDPSIEMTKLTFKTICEAAFEYEATDAEHDEFRESLDTALREFTFRQSTNPLRKLFGFFIPTVREAFECAARVQGFGRKVLEAYRNNPNKAKAKTLIQLIENNPYNFTAEEKATEIPLYMIAGKDTTGYTLACALMHLAMHPEEIKKTRESLWYVYIANLEDAQDDAPTGKSRPAYHNIKPSGYLHQVITESRRFLPVNSVGSIRETGREFTFSTKEAATWVDKDESGDDDGHTSIDDTKFVIPKGAKVLLPQSMSQADPSVFENPHGFRPERWNHATKEMTQSLLTFSAGVRNCAGQSLAMAELNTTLALLILKYDFEVVDPGRLEYFLFLRYIGSQLRVKRAPIPDFAKHLESKMFGA